MNNRQAIREALKTMLTGQTVATNNIYSNRKSGLWETELPAILIYTTDELAKPVTLQGRQYLRTVQLSVEVRIEGSDTVDDDVDSLLGAIEDIVIADQSIGGTVLITTHTNTQTSINSAADQNIGVGMLSFECQYIA
jgi:hypothetical protein